MFERSLEREHIRVKILRFSSINGMRECLKRGIGVTLCPEASVERELKGKKMVRLRFRPHLDKVSLIMIWHAEKWCSPLLKHFKQLSEQVMSE